MAIDYLPISWQTYHSHVLKLADTILDANLSIDEIVAISRGGLTLGHLLSDFLKIPISTITIQSYTDIQQSGEVKLTAKLQNSIKKKHILLVDDVADSGKTMKRATKYLRRAGASRVTTASMFFKPKSNFHPDFITQQTTKWILFPYEPAEMLTLIAKNMKKDGKSSHEIKQFLTQIGYSDEQMEFVSDHYLNGILR